jgi:hypothetical protein
MMLFEDVDGVPMSSSNHVVNDGLKEYEVNVLSWKRSIEDAGCPWLRKFMHLAR